MRIGELLNPPPIGLFSKTLARPPSIRQVLPARIRSKHKDDLIFVGKDFIHLHEIDHEGHLTHIASKDDFDCKIMSAGVIGHFDACENEFNGSQDDADGHSVSDGTKMAPQMLVTVLDTSQLVFHTVHESENGGINYRSSSIPLLKRPGAQALGKHLAVEPRSRAIAVAAGEDNLVIFSAKQAGLLTTGQRWDNGFLPVSGSRFIQLPPAKILLMDFLHPRKEDPDRVVLVLIVLQDNGIHPILVEWSHEADVQSAEVKRLQKILTHGEMPNLLIPCKKNAAFILASEKRVIVCQDILTGYVKRIRVSIDREDSPDGYPPSSGRPRWSGWMKPRRDANMSEEYVYMFTEDSHVYYAELDAEHPAEGPIINHIAHLGCHIDCAFAPFGKSDGGDVLVVLGEASEGGVWMTECLQEPVTDDGPRGGMEAYKVIPLSNWSRNFDLVARSGSQKRSSQHSRSSLFAPSGRQPYGCVSEIRMGIEALTAFHMPPSEIFSSALKAWVLPNQLRDEFLLLLSSPVSSRFMSIPQALTSENLDAIEESTPVGLDRHHSTLAAATIGNNYIFQVSEGGISISLGGRESLLFDQWPPGNKVTAAAIADTIACAVVSLHANGRSQLGVLKADIDDRDASLTTIGKPAEIDAEIISVDVCRTKHGPFAVAGTSDGRFQFYRLCPQQGLILAFQHTITQNPDNLEALVACEEIVMLSEQTTTSAGCVNIMVVCGLRGGYLYAIELQASQTTVQPRSHKHFTLGLTTVKLTCGTDGCSVFAACEDGLFKATWSGPGTESLQISNVWITDRDDRSLRQDGITAFSMVPYMDQSTLSDALLLASGQGCYITAVSDDPTIVPRSISSCGSPHVLFESKQLDCLISASTTIRLRSPTTRTVQEMIELISPKYGHLCSLALDPGFKVHSMMELNYRSASGSNHCFVALAVGRIESPDDERISSRRGQIILLRPTKATQGVLKGQVESVHMAMAKSFDAPVLSIATFSETTYAACIGTRVYLFELKPDEKSKFGFDEACSHELRSKTIHVTTAPPYVHVNTACDSVTTLRVTTYTGSQGEEKKAFVIVANDSASRVGGSHITLSIQHEDTSTTDLNMVSTRAGEVIGLGIPPTDHQVISRTQSPLFKATLPRSLMRVVQGKIRPPWKPARVRGVLEDELAGISVDGGVYGLALIDERLTQRLRWVQRLCQRNDDICPHSYNVQSSNPSPQPILSPFGFGTGLENGISRTKHRPEDMCVDGDILQRLLDRGGADRLRQVLNLEAQRANDALSIWVRDNLDMMMGEVDALIQEMAAVTDRWF